MCDAFKNGAWGSSPIREIPPPEALPAYKKRFIAPHDGPRPASGKGFELMCDAFKSGAWGSSPIREIPPPEALPALRSDSLLLMMDPDLRRGEVLSCGHAFETLACGQ